MCTCVSVSVCVSVCVSVRHVAMKRICALFFFCKHMGLVVLVQGKKCSVGIREQKIHASIKKTENGLLFSTRCVRGEVLLRLVLSLS